jgi:hypothetical protein
LTAEQAQRKRLPDTFAAEFRFLNSVSTMSMFSGFTNQISGWVATKTGAGGNPEEDPNAQQQHMVPENGAEMMGEECQAGEGQVHLRGGRLKRP